MYGIPEGVFKPLTIKFVKHLLSSIDVTQGSIRQQKLLEALSAVDDLEKEYAKDSSKHELNQMRGVYLQEVINVGLPIRWFGSLLDCFKGE